MSAHDHLSPEQFPAALSWDDVQAKHPVYDKYHHHGVTELAHDGEPEQHLPFTEESVHPRNVRFQRYPASDARVSKALEGYSSGAEMPPVLLVSRAGESLTADGHHRLSAAEILNRPVPAMVANSPRQDKYSGKARIGTLRPPRKKPQS